jgi:anti-sigma factor RsiW
VTCPGDLLSGLVDGELDHAARERVLSHLLACQACHTEVDALRALKGRLAWAGAETPLPAPDLTARLLAMAVPGVDPSAHSRGGQRTRVVHAVGLTPGGRRRDPARPSTPRRLRRRTVGTLVALGLSAAFVLGGQSASPAPRVPIDPATDQFVTDYVDATVEVPVNEPVHAVTADVLVGPRR